MNMFGKVLGFGCLGLVILFVVLASVGGSLGDEPESAWQDVALAEADQSNSLQSEEIGNQNTENSSKWNYSQTTDEMRNSAAYFASIKSENTVDFDFPYEGSQRMQIQFRKSPAFGKDIIFAIERGQIMCDVYDCIGNISFDGKTEKLTLGRSADNTTTIGFARYPDALARKFKSSSKVVVELTFYQEGVRQFVFETQGLEWSHF